MKDGWGRSTTEESDEAMDQYLGSISSIGVVNIDIRTAQMRKKIKATGARKRKVAQMQRRIPTKRVQKLVITLNF